MAPRDSPIRLIIDNHEAPGRAAKKKVKKQLSLSPETDTTSTRTFTPDPSSTKSLISLKASKDSFSSAPLSFKQGLCAVVVFVLGINSGIRYVGWVQHTYGFGMDPEMEQKLLPFGPHTHQQTAALLSRALATNQRQQPPPMSNKRKKQIRLNRDIPNPQKSIVGTLFGMDYDNLVGRTQDCPVKEAQPTLANEVSPEPYRLASNRRVALIDTEKAMMQSVALKVHENIQNLTQRAGQVSWGGPHSDAAEKTTNWWSPKTSITHHPNDLSTMDGGHLLYAYLFITKWDPHPHFPFRLCGEDGCPPERAIAHTLQWREAYKPWMAPPSLLEENKNGYSYHHGFSRAEAPGGKHSIVWLRLGHRVKHELSFFRGILNTADRAISEALVASNGETGKFNVIIDCAGFSLSGGPTMQSLKQAITMLQDHYPNRLGMIFLAHLSRTGEVMLKLVLGLITKDVKAKVTILPNNDKPKSTAILRAVVEEEYIPDWLGGEDTYSFDVSSYYPPHHRCTEAEAQEFLTSMPYHAK